MRCFSEWDLEECGELEHEIAYPLVKFVVLIKKKFLTGYLKVKKVSVKEICFPHSLFILMGEVLSTTVTKAHDRCWVD